MQVLKSLVWLTHGLSTAKTEVWSRADSKQPTRHRLLRPLRVVLVACHPQSCRQVLKSRRSAPHSVYFVSLFTFSLLEQTSNPLQSPTRFRAISPISLHVPFSALPTDDHDDDDDDENSSSANKNSSSNIYVVKFIAFARLCKLNAMRLFKIRFRNVRSMLIYFMINFIMACALSSGFSILMTESYLSEDRSACVLAFCNFTLYCLRHSYRHSCTTNTYQSSRFLSIPTGRLQR